MTIEDNKRRQIRESAERYGFADKEIRRVISSPDFTIGRLVVQANRVIASPETSEEAARDAKNAQALLDQINRLDSK